MSDNKKIISYKEAIQLEQLAEKIDIVELIASHIPLTRIRPMIFKGNCPFCEGDNFWVYKVPQIFRCHNCNKHGDIFEFLMSRENWDLPKAKEYLEKISAQKKMDIENPIVESLLRSCKELGISIDDLSAAEKMLNYHLLWLDNSIGSLQNQLETLAFNLADINKAIEGTHDAT